MSLWTDHKRRWQNCNLCPLHLTRTNVVLARGSIPAPILLIGESPGTSEDVLGSCFMGPAGKLLDKIMVQAGFYVTDHDILPVRFAMTNLVACLPLGEDGTKTAEPPKESIEACSPRLIEFILLCQPKYVICVGGLSEKWMGKILERAYEERPKSRGNNVGVGASKGRVQPANKDSRAAVKGSKRSGETKSASGRLAAEDANGIGSSGDGKPRVVSITHPAAVLRSNIAGRGLMIQRMVVTLADVLAELDEERNKDVAGST